MSVAFSLPANVAPRGLPPMAETLPAAIEKLIREINLEKIVLFGSYAYGNPTPDSDVDLLIIWDTDKPRRERVITISYCCTRVCFLWTLLSKRHTNWRRKRHITSFCKKS
ncbi:MAG: nucleotidyltransferase domain-containing protein [Roseiflexus sp.]|nr:nucleotidyltransferase domain-containing protein [Roseiflexus sp.]MCS7290257.1 nucleotidyltransferase domain-containing protein [Roseiflexus sp.]MDW8146011.1 nucleotidyltransferase domain-containing protein [Roseiflexaceae bacterium]